MVPTGPLLHHQRVRLRRRDPYRVHDVAAYGDGGITAQVTVSASSTGKMTMTPVITNTDQLTGFNYALQCHVGEHEVAVLDTSGRRL